MLFSSHININCTKIKRKHCRAGPVPQPPECPQEAFSGLLPLSGFSFWP